MQPIEQIQAYWTANTALQASLPIFYTGTIPPNTAFPYASLHPINSKPHPLTQQAFWEQFDFEIGVFTVSAVQLETLTNLVMDEFDYVLFNNTSISNIRQGYVVKGDPTLSSARYIPTLIDSRYVYSAFLTYQYRFNTSLVSSQQPPVTTINPPTYVNSVSNTDSLLTVSPHIGNVVVNVATIDIPHGGTGATSANAALNALLPGQGSSANKVLTTDGANTSWVLPASAPVTTVDASSPLSVNATTGNVIISLGTVPIGSGGTGQTTASGAINALAPSQTGNSGKFLTSNGSAVSWGSITSGVSSVSNSDGTITASPTTGAVVLSLPTVAIAHGGTGQTTASGAINALAPSQTGNSGKVLTTNGTAVSWGTDGSALTSLTAANISSGTAGISISGNAANVSGTVAIANGGTGQTSATSAFNALAPSQTSNSGKFLTTNGTNTSWASVTSGVSSVSVNSPLTEDSSTGAITLSLGTVPIGSGGTGQTTAANAINALAPSQTGNSGKFLTSNGTSVSWGVNGSALTTLTAANISSGTAGIDISGNAATATNGVVTSGSYSNPTWITSLAASKLTGQVALANGGTGANLTDPNADTLLGWDDTDNAVKFLTIGTGLAYTHSTHTLSATGGGGNVNSVSNTDGYLTVSPTTGDVIANLNLSSDIIDAIVPDQTGNNGKVLTTDGSNTSWATTSGVSVASVANSDGSLTISPTTGSVVASLNVGHSNTWTAGQLFDVGASNVALAVKANISQSANITEWRDHNNFVKAAIDPAGELLIDTILDNGSHSITLSPNGASGAINLNGDTTCSQGTTSHVPLTVAVHSNSTVNTQEWAVLGGSTVASIDINGHLTAEGYTGGNLSITSNNAGVPASVFKGASIQTADLITCKDNSNAVQFAIGNTGQIKTNNFISGSTLGNVVGGLQVFDASGNSLGYLPIYDSVS